MSLDLDSLLCETADDMQSQDHSNDTDIAHDSGLDSVQMVAQKDYVYAFKLPVDVQRNGEAMCLPIRYTTVEKQVYFEAYNLILWLGYSSVMILLGGLLFEPELSCRVQPYNHIAQGLHCDTFFFQYNHSSCLQCRYFGINELIYIPHTQPQISFPCCNSPRFRLLLRPN